MLLTLIILTIFFILCMTFGDDVIGGLGLTGFLFTVVIGWGLIACVWPKRSEYYTVKISKPSITLSDNSFLVFYTDKDGKETFAQFYQLSDLKYKDAKILKMRRDFNIYGFQTRNDYVFDVVVENLEEK